MFRPTHFVILFAVVLCAAAFPGPPAGPVPQGPVRIPGAGLAPKQPVQGPAGPVAPAKGDLDTDATSHWGYRYAYNAPTWGYYSPGWDANSYSWRSWYHGY